MKITFQPQFGITSPNTCKNNSLYKNMPSDTFVRNTSFGDNGDKKSYAEFNLWAKKSNFELIARDIVTDKKNHIGSDSEGEIYSIPNTENWVLKKHKRTDLYPRQTKKVEYTEVEDISPQINIGQKIASLWIPMSDYVTTHFYVHKKQEGGPLGVRKLFRNSVSATSSREHIESLAKLANLPKESYEKLAEEVKFISEKGFGINGSETSNFSIDMNSNRINLVVTEKNNQRKTPQHAEVLYALLGGNFALKYNSSHRPDTEKDTANMYSYTIANKYINAVYNTGDEFKVTEHFKNIFPYLHEILQNT